MPIPSIDKQPAAKKRRKPVVHLIGFPMDLGADRRGVDMGPSALRIADLDDKLIALGYDVCDEGDIEVKVPEVLKIQDPTLKYLPEISNACDRLARKVKRVLKDGNFPLVLGGDHSMAIGTIAGVAGYCRGEKKRLGVIWIDAHSDINVPGTSPSGNIHGMPVAASIGIGAKELTKVGGDFQKLDPANIVMIGLRSVDEGERALIREHGIKTYTMSDIDRLGAYHVMHETLDYLQDRTDFIHVSFDLDSVDPSIAMGVGTPVPGGLTYREAHLIMEIIAERGALSSLEVAEVNPILDTVNRSAQFATDLVASAMGEADFMRTIDTVSEVRYICESFRQGLKTIALVPTMGYLHDGHLALVEKARSRADVVIASIFVNPTQFAPSEDLSTYPRDPEGDAQKLEDAGCDILFAPPVSEIYPAGFSTYVQVEGLTASFEGASRPTHFRGVTTVVAKLFNIIRPHVAVFGQKDAQQVAVIRKMIADLDHDIRLVVVETIRESDGLAMSSRNVYLSDEDRGHAVTISRALRAAREALAAGAGLEDARFRMREEISPAIALDYAEIIDGDLFEPATHHSKRLVGIFAGRVGKTRLIDNMELGVMNDE